MLRFFQETQRIEDFKSAYPEFEDNDIKDMRMALLLSGDLEHVYGLTQSARYKTTKLGLQKIGE